MRKKLRFLAKAARLSDGLSELPPRNPSTDYKSCISKKHIWTALPDGFPARSAIFIIKSNARLNRERR